MRIHRLIFFLTVILLLSFACKKENENPPDDGGKVIVLMYHRIVEGEASNLYERSVKNLERDLNYLKDNNITILSFNDLETISTTGKISGGNSAIITFDDGDNSWYTIVKPLLLKYKMKATFFLWTHMIGNNSFLTWQEVEDMAHYALINGERPFKFESHTYSHQYLFKTKDNYTSDAEYNSFLDYELRRSKEIIEEHTPGVVEVLSLPYGDGAGDPEIIAAAKRNGYKYIRTSIWGAIENADQDLFVIPSLPILDTTEPELIGFYLGL